MSSQRATRINFLQQVAATPINEAIPSDRLANALEGFPFTTVPGSLNLRDIGAFAPTFIAPKKVFRSGTLDFMPENRRALLRSNMGITTVYDLRRADEVRGPFAAGGDGPVVVSCPYMDGTAVPEPVNLGDYVPKEDGSLGMGYRKMHEDILQGYRTGYRKVFEGIRDARSGQAVLFHCTAGKDRTGVLSALILNLMGAPADIIGLEYSLTRIGVEPFREKLLPAALESVGGFVGAEAAEVDLTTLPGVKEFMSIDAVVMEDFVKYLQEKYGGARGYLLSELGFSEPDIEKIRQNLSPDA